MAVIRQETIVIRVSRLVKNASDAENIDSDLSASVIDNIETIVQELVGNSVVVEIETQETQIK